MDFFLNIILFRKGSKWYLGNLLILCLRFHIFSIVAYIEVIVCRAFRDGTDKAISFPFLSFHVPQHGRIRVWRRHNGRYSPTMYSWYREARYEDKCLEMLLSNQFDMLWIKILTWISSASLCCTILTLCLFERENWYFQPDNDPNIYARCQSVLAEGTDFPLHINFNGWIFSLSNYLE